MTPVETTPGMGEGRIKENDGGWIQVGYIWYCKNFCKCHNVPPAEKWKKK
jgi:hypothetical protein